MDTFPASELSTDIHQHVIWRENKRFKVYLQSFNGGAFLSENAFNRPSAETLSLAFLNASLTDEVVHTAVILNEEARLKLSIDNCRLMGISMANIANGRTLYEQCYQTVRRRFIHNVYVTARIKHTFAAAMHHIVYPYYVAELTRVMIKSYGNMATPSELFKEVLQQATFISGERKREGFGVASLLETLQVRGEYWKERLHLRSVSTTDETVRNKNEDETTQTASSDVDLTRAVATAAAEAAVEMFQRCCWNHYWYSAQDFESNNNSALEPITP